MAQETQIVPKYLHSHVETYINDYTAFQDETSVPVDTNSKFVAVFRSAKGIDNVFVKKSDLSDFTKTYGKSDYSKYGQPLMMPIAMLSSGSASVYCMRIMPDDAFAANGILCMLYKTDDSTGKMTIKYEAVTAPKSAFTSAEDYKTNKAFKKALTTYAMSLETTTADEDGFKTIPIATFRMSGRGAYGNNYRWRITRNLEYENDYEMKMYSFEALDSTNGLEKVATYVGSIVTPANSSSSTLINDVLDDTEVGAAVMDVQIIEDNVIKAYNIFAAFVGTLSSALQSPVPPIDEWDPFFGYGLGTTTVNTNMAFVAEAEDEPQISVDRPQGVSLASGDEGAFGAASAQSVYTAEVAAYINAFSGNYDTAILSSRRMEINAIFDANYPDEVKETIADLINTRKSGMFYMDAGVETKVSTIDDTITEYAAFNSRNISKSFQHYTVKDPTTNKKCEVTMTYFLAQKLPSHYANVGYWVPFVKGYAQLTGHVKNSVEPNIDDIDMDIKEKLYTNRWNYFETVEENIYQRASQNTAQMLNSDLMEENNMNTLFALKKVIERDAWDNLYTFTSARERAEFSEYERAKFSNWIGIRVASLDIVFDANEWEGERSIVHCYVSVQFRNLNKRTIIEIDVNKRDFAG